MRTLKSLIMTALMLFVSSCATTEKYEEVLSSWVRKPASELFYTWGAPASSFTDSMGNKFYTYNYNGGSVGNTFLNPPGGGATTYVNSYWCKTTFIANSSDVIQSWKWEGNSCKSK